jgi:hypothetical protein
MSIKYLQDQQLNQVQQSPNNSPWAKLIAQSEMLERNRMRQPQGQAPQGTVAGNIQQQLIDAQMKQESEAQNADLYKSQMLAQLIGSGQLPTNFSAQGYADGGLAQPQAGTGAYRGIMMPSQGAGANPSYAPKQPTLSYVPPSSQDPAAQEKKHGMLQTLLDNSMYSGKGTIDSNMQMYSDMLTGKLFGRGFAEGGDVRGFAAGGESMAEQLARIKPQIEATLRDQGWTKEAIDRYVSAYKPEMGRGFTNQFPATTAQPPSLNDMLEMQRRKMAQTGLGVKDPNTIHIPPESGYPTGVSPKPYMQNAPQQTPAMETLAQSPEAQKLLAGPPSRVALPHITQVSESPELQDYYKSLYGPKPEATRSDILSQLGKANAPGEDQMRIPTREAMLRQTQGASTGTDSLAEFKNRMYGENTGALNAPRSNLMGTLLNVAEQKEALANQPKPSMTEGMSAAAQNPPRVDTMASQMSAADQANSAAKAEAIKAAKSSLIGKGIRSLGLGMGPSAVESMSDIIAPEDWAAKNKALDTGGMHGALGWYAGKVGEGFKQGNERIAQNMSGIGDTIKSNITQPLNEFWNGPNAGAQTNAPPSVPQTDISQFGVDTKAAIPQQPTIGDFSGSATPQTKGPATNEKGVITNPHSANKHESTTANTAAINQAHGQGQTQDTSPVAQAVQQAATVAQADQAANRSSDTGMGQGSILDSLYSKLKDTDVDYSDLAKRISENEYDLARERKDGTFNAILGGVGAALSKAGTYESHGDRVFRPGYGAIAGAGITGGLKMANESDAAIAKKSQDNTMSMLALKKLKGDSLNNVLDAISAQKQNEVYARSVAQSGEHNIATAKHQAGQLVEEAKKTDILQQAANTNAARVNAEIEDLKNKMPPADAAMLTSLSKTIDDAQAKINGMDKGFVAKDDAEYLRAQTAYNNAFNALNGLYSKYGINLGAGANTPVRGPNAIKVISRERI